jgi:prepilin-type processing-associated H-X9-DG protein
LLELLVVIAIIGILAALLMTALSRAQQRARKISCIGNLHQLGIGLQLFVAGNGGYPSIFGDTNGNNPGLWQAQLENGGFGTSVATSNYTRWLPPKGVWKCPSAQWPSNAEFNPQSYGYNVMGVVKVVSVDPANALGLFGEPSPNNARVFMPVKESGVAQPGAMMAIGDSFLGGGFIVRNLLEETVFAPMWHDGKANVLFCDGHVESPTLDYLFVNTNNAALVRWNRDHQPHRDHL